MLEGFFGAVFVGLIILGVFAVVYAVRPANRAVAEKGKK